MLAITISFSKTCCRKGSNFRLTGCTGIPCTWLRPLLGALLLWTLTGHSGAADADVENVLRHRYETARGAYSRGPTNATAAWSFGRAAYELADFLEDDEERKPIAERGVDACRQAISLDPNSAPAHYYLALNLGETARAKKLGALRILHEMERELLKAARLDAAFDYGGADRALGMLYLQAPPWPVSIGNRNKARTDLEKALQLSPEYPDNHICLAEAYARWGEIRNLESELNKIRRLRAQAHSRFAGESWVSSWQDWEKRLSKLEKEQERLASTPRVSPGERGARPGR